MGLRGKVLRDPYLKPNRGNMQFRLTYAGKLLAHRDDGRLRERSLHVHEIRREFHRQLKALWDKHPVLKQNKKWSDEDSNGMMMVQYFQHDGFKWLPIVTEQNGLICALDILMLREGRPGKVPYDLDNRVKTIFDALRKAKGVFELGASTSAGVQVPSVDEDTFFVLLEDDNLITQASVTTDTLLEPVPNTTPDDAVRLIITVTVRPYHAHLENSDFV
jgi:hypothetical protein